MNSQRRPTADAVAHVDEDESEVGGASGTNNTFTGGEDEHNTSFEQTVGGTVLASLSKKKQQYLEQKIEDRSG